MEVKAKLNYLRIAPRKIRLLANLIRGEKIKEAKTLLDFSLKKGAEPLRKLLDSAQENARNNFQLDVDTLRVSKIMVGEGPKLKRWRARARGRAAEIQKKTSHITLVLEGEKEKRIEKIEKGKPEKKLKPKTKPEAPKPEKEIGPPKMKKKGWTPPTRRPGIFRRKAF